MARRRNRRGAVGELFPEFAEARGHLLKSQKEFLLAVRSILDRAIERAEDVGRQQKERTIKKVEIK